MSERPGSDGSKREASTPPESPYTTLDDFLVGEGFEKKREPTRDYSPQPYGGTAGAVPPQPPTPPSADPYPPMHAQGPWPSAGYGEPLMAQPVPPAYGVPVHPTMPPQYYVVQRPPRRRNNPWAHLGLFLFTGGIGNVIYALWVHDSNRRAGYY